MYYPIIDKLKTLMTDIASVKSKEPLIIEGTVTSATGGTWTGDWNDIIHAFGNRPIYFKVATYFIPVIELSGITASSSIIYFNDTMVYGLIFDAGNFVLKPVQ